jgi:hypothetical protein
MTHTTENPPYSAIGQDPNTGLYHGLIYNGRHRLRFSTIEGFQTQRAAGEFVNAIKFDGTKVDLTKCSDVNEFIGLPTLPPGAEITVMTYNYKSYDPAPKEELPKIVVRLHGKVDIQLSEAHVKILVMRKEIILDSTSGYDPNLSCLYTYYYVPFASPVAV